MTERPRCSGCRDLIRSEDDFLRSETGHWWHVECWEFVEID